MYVQVALSILESDAIEREFGNLKNIPDNYPKKVLTMPAFFGNTVEGIETQDLRSFLMTYGGLKLKAGGKEILADHAPERFVHRYFSRAIIEKISHELGYDPVTPPERRHM